MALLCIFSFGYTSKSIQLPLVFEIGALDTHQGMRSVTLDICRMFWKIGLYLQRLLYGKIVLLLYAIRVIFAHASRYTHLAVFLCVQPWMRLLAFVCGVSKIIRCLTYKNQFKNKSQLSLFVLKRSQNIS